MIIEYNSKYNEEIKDLLVELQEHIVNIDKLKYNIITDKYREEYFKETMNEVSKYQGKIYLYQEDNKIIGAVTHTVISDNTKGYGISIIKMLESME